MKKMMVAGTLCAAVSFLSGCEYLAMGANNQHPSVFDGGDLIKAPEEEKLDLANLVAEKAGEELGEVVDPFERVNKSITLFYKNIQDAEEQKLQRNRIQDALLSESERLCSDFKQILHRVRSNWDFYTGAGSTIAGAVGALTNASASYWAGASGIFSGIRAEGNQAYFQNLASQVIVDGITLRRKRVRNEILEKGQIRTIHRYSLEGAIRDAIYYHSQCHVITGFQVAQESIKTVENPGLNMVAKVMAQQAVIKSIVEAKTNLDTIKQIKQDSEELGLNEVGIPASLSDKTPAENVAGQPGAANQRALDSETASVQAELGAFSEEAVNMGADVDLVLAANKGLFDQLAKDLKEDAKGYVIKGENVAKAQQAALDLVGALSTYQTADQTDKTIKELELEGKIITANIYAEKIRSHGLKVRAEMTTAWTTFQKEVKAAAKDGAKLVTAVATLKASVKKALAIEFKDT